jgi:fibronectin type 3 domain-containing protein
VNKAHESPNTGKSRFSPNPRRRSRWLRALAGSCLAIALTSGPALASSATTTAATAPPFCLAALAGNGQVRLGWFPRAPENDLVIRYSTGREFATSTVATSDPVQGLKNKSPYFFWLAAGPNHEVLASNMVMAVPMPNPPAPTSFCLGAVAGNGEVRLKWFPPAPATGLAIYDGADTNSSNAGRVADAIGTSAQVDTLADKTPLVNGTTYYFWLGQEGVINSPNAAVDTGPQVMSNMASATPVGPPGQPSGVTATPGNGQATLSWTAPGSDGGAPISGYDLHQGTSSGGETSESPVSGTSTTVTGLANGTTYFFTVTAANAVGQGPASQEVSATPATVPGEPVGLTATPGDSHVTLSWSAPGSDGGAAISQYIVRDGTSSGRESDAPVSGSPVTGTSTTVTGLNNGTTYYFKVYAVNRVGGGQTSAEVPATPAAAPGAPVKLTALPGNGQVTLSWEPPVANGGLKITGYRLYAGTSPDFSGKAPLLPLTGTAATVTNLVNGTTYYFKVTTTNGTGEGPGSETEAVPVTTPGAPTNLTATSGKSQATLSWSAPVSNGGTGIISYIVSEGTSPGGETGAKISGSPASGSSTTVTGLHSGTTYYFTVAARNAAGLSGQSNEASAALPPIVIHTPTSPAATSNAANHSSGPTESSGPTQPGGSIQSSVDAQSTSSAPILVQTPPTGLTATPGNAMVHLSWLPPLPDGGPPLTGYKLYYSKDPGLRSSTLLGSPSGTGGIESNVSSLVNGTVYYFVVTAVNAAGHEGPASTEVSAEPNGPPPMVQVGLGTPLVPTQVTALLAAVATLIAAGVFTLVARHRRRVRPRGKHSLGRGRKHPGQQPAAAGDVRAVPSAARPPTVSIRETGPQPTRTVRLERHPGVAITTIREKP